MYSLTLEGLAALSLVLTARAQLALPQVDLGYETHQAISFNSSSQVYNFSNIRFAQPPLGDLRFAAPLPPTGRNPGVQNGSVGVVCPQAEPSWEAILPEFLDAYLTGQPFDFDATVAALEASNVTVAPPLDPRTTEDCLFLDLLVPKSIFDAAQDPNCNETGAAVLIWIYGGGYVYGSKESTGNPSGLIEASQATGNEGVVYIAPNYRLGAFGWLAGPLLRASNGTSNAALYDQRLAIEWARKYAHLFGGDPERITIMGESAGGGSVTHQITAYGGQKPVAFQQAIAQSPGWLPIVGHTEQDNITETFLDILGVDTIEEARQLPSETLIAANALQVSNAKYGQYVYGPMVDGDFVPDLPGKLLLNGSFAQDVKVMVGHNSDEGLIFTDPRIQNDTALAAWLRSSFPLISDSALTYIIDTLYPAIFDGSYGYSDPVARVALLVSEVIFACNTNYLDRAYNNQTYAYEFAVPPGLHGEDLAYTFYNGPSASVVSSTLAQALQLYLTNFVQSGAPNGVGLPYFPVYGAGALEQDLNVTGIFPIRDPTANPRCLWWQQALYST